MGLVLPLGLSSGVILRRIHRDCSTVMGVGVVLSLGVGSCYHWGWDVGGNRFSVFIETRAYERG